MSKSKLRAQQTRRAAFVLDKPGLLSMPVDALRSFWWGRKYSARFNNPN